MKRSILATLAIILGVALCWAAPPVDKLPSLLTTPSETRNISVIVGGSVPAAAAEDYVVATCYAYIANADASGENTMMAIYNSSGTRIGESNAAAIGTTGFPKWIAHTFSSGPTLTATALYYIGLAGDGYINPMSRSTPTYKMRSRARGTWPSTATAITPGSDTEDSAGEYGMYCSNASAVLLIGNSTSGNFGANADQFPAATSTMYNEDGYTCVTQ